MRPDTIDRVGHMLDAAREASAFVANRERDAIRGDRMLALALVKLLEIIGEAASAIPIEFRTAHPTIPWRAIIGMRNRLIHGYFDIDTDIVWDTVTRNLPPLIPALERVLEDEGKQGPAGLASGSGQ